jgi:SAM-dependent methyltransferase
MLLPGAVQCFIVSFMNKSQALSANRSYWNAVSELHEKAGGVYYNIPAILDGRDTLFQHENAAVGDVEGLDVLHVQCHIGFDSISLARRGARVTGVDLSPVALRAARQLAERCTTPVTFVEADASELPASLHSRFDLAFAALGVIYWVPDAEVWMRSVAACLRPGGRLVLVEYHPVMAMLTSLDPPLATGSYAGSGPCVVPWQGTYADPGARVEAPTPVTYQHTLGTVVTAAVSAGLRPRLLEEHTEADVGDTGTAASREGDGRVRARLGGGALPLMFTLVAERAG